MPNQPHDDNQPPAPAPAPLTPSASAPDWQQQAVASAQANVTSSQPQSSQSTPDEPSEPDNWQQPQPPAPQPPVDQPQPAAVPAQPAAVVAPGAVVGAGGGEPTGTPSYHHPMTPAPDSKKMLLIIGVAVGGLIVIAIAILLAVKLFSNSAAKKNNTNTSASASQIAEQSSNASSKSGIDLATLQSVTLVAPTDMSAYQAPTHLIDTYSRYSTKDNACSLDMGQVPTSYTQLEGATIDAVVAFNIKALRDVGATVSEPVAGDALVLKDSKNSSKTYKLPTLRFTVTKDAAKAFSDYSVAVTKNGDRVIIVRACGSDSGALTADSLKPLNAVAEKITVTAP